MKPGSVQVLWAVALVLALVAGAGGEPAHALEGDEKMLALAPPTSVLAVENCGVSLRVLDKKVRQNKQAASAMRIDRIAGCYGAVAAARERILPAEGNLKEPKYQETWVQGAAGPISSFEAGVFSLSPASNSACVIDDEPLGVLESTQQVQDLSQYLSERYDCACGDCYDAEQDASYGEDELESRATNADRKAYREYEAKRSVEFAEAKKLYAEYVSEYKRWKQERAEMLHTPSVRVAITATTEIPAGTLAVYSYRWTEDRWCGDLRSVGRAALAQRRIQHPVVPAGQTLEIWLENVDLTLAWGVVVNRDPARLDDDFRLLEAEAGRRAEGTITPLDGLPGPISGRAFETPGKGTSAEISNDCCSC